MKHTSRSFYLSIFFILLFSMPVLADTVAIVSRKSAVLRQAPGREGKIILTVKRGYRFKVLGQRGNSGWRYVYDPGKKISGWILASDVRVIVEDSLLKYRGARPRIE